MFVYVVNVCPSHPSTFPTPAPGRSYALYDVLTNYKIELNFANIVQICVIWLSYLHLCNRVRYVCFSHKLRILVPISSNKFSLLLPLLLLGLLLELEKYQILFFIIHINPNFGSLIYLLLKFSKTISRSIFNALPFYIFSISVTKKLTIQANGVFQISIKKCVPLWWLILLILIPDDIYMNINFILELKLVDQGQFSPSSSY